MLSNSQFRHKNGQAGRLSAIFLNIYKVYLFYNTMKKTNTIFCVTAAGIKYILLQPSLQKGIKTEEIPEICDADEVKQ